MDSPEISWTKNAGLGLVDFLKFAVTPTIVDELYRDPPTCRVIFRHVHELCRQCIVRLLYIDSPVAEPVLRQWLGSESTERIGELEALYILQRNGMDENGIHSFQINSKFQSNIRATIHNEEHHELDLLRRVLPSTDAPKAPSSSQVKVEGGSAPGRLPTEEERQEALQALMDDARARWRNVLLFVAQTAEITAKDNRELGRAREPSLPILALLKDAGIIDKRKAGSQPGKQWMIKTGGYEFLLQNTARQFWILTRRRLEVALRQTQARQDQNANLENGNVLGDVEKRLVHQLNFLFTLCECEPGELYAVDRLQDAGKDMLDLMIWLGVARKEQGEVGDQFFVTPLARALVRSSEADVAQDGVGANESAGELQLIVETNFRVYAYTTSDLHISMMGLFVHLQWRFPNLVAGQIDDDSVRHAYKVLGITPAQIYNFLLTHAHPTMQERNPVIPENVADQLLLWYNEVMNENDEDNEEQ